MTNKDRDRSTSSRQVAVFLATLLVLVPAVALVSVLVLFKPTPEEIDPPPAPIYVAPTELLDWDRQQVIVRTRLTEPMVLRSPGGDGLITGVPLSEGDVVANGSVALEVDGASLMAMRAAAPPHREIALGSEGSDVLDLESMLSELSLFRGEPDEVFDTETRSAVLALEVMAGWRQSGVFKPFYVVWLPGKEFPIAEVLVAAGEDLPRRGEVIASSVPLFASTSLTATDGRVVDVGEGTYQLTIHSEVLGTVTGSGELESVFQDEIRALSAPTDDPLVIEILGEIARTQPEILWSVPISAVVEASNGSCVWSESPTGPIPTPVTVVGTALGAVYVEWGGEIPKRILANPVETLDDAACSSS